MLGHTHTFSITYVLGLALIECCTGFSDSDICIICDKTVADPGSNLIESLCM